MIASGSAKWDCRSRRCNWRCITAKEEFDDDKSDDSADEDYRGDIYEDDYSDGEEDLLLKYRVPSARGRGAGRKPKTGRPPKPDTKGMSQGDALALMTDWKKMEEGE